MWVIFIYDDVWEYKKNCPITKKRWNIPLLKNNSRRLRHVNPALQSRQRRVKPLENDGFKCNLYDRGEAPYGTVQSVLRQSFTLFQIRFGSVYQYASQLSSLRCKL